MKKRVLVLCATLTCIGATQISPKGGGYLFRMRFVPGTTIRYRMAVNAAIPKSYGQKGDYKMVAPMTITVRRVDKGVATLDYRLGPAEGNNAQSMPLNKGTMRQNNRGETLGGKADSSPSVPFPQQPVKIGGSWSSYVSMGMGVGSQRLRATYTLTAVRKVAGRQVALLTVLMRPTNPQEPTASGTVLLRMTDGTLERMDLTSLVGGPQGQNIRVLTKLVRL